MLSLNVPDLITCQTVITGTLTCAEGTPVDNGEVAFLDFPQDNVTYNPNPAITDANGNFSTTVTVNPDTELLSLVVNASSVVFGEVQQGSAGTQIICSPDPPPPPVECPCKFRLGVARNRATATATVVDNGAPFDLTGIINITAVQCFTASTMCNPNVDNFNITFNAGGTTINFVQGRRIEIGCEGNNVARIRGTAIGRGNLYSGLFDVNIEVVVDENNVGTWTIDAFDDMNHSFSTVFTALMNPITSIGECDVQF
ncbi:hypothetical protein QRD89_18555 [Halobacillus sp. ACCC02827]|uniref:hypothetical protein n=1 Tax=Halobacillus sp. ACCC02827 TaxID=3052090 RepID=UPI002570E881|nr:hypothetical protein [Halobacillus sp. ACCC02827]WJE15697.1 hypothetical protein QRD89_18555 [Halobacillus sp. ACCC02827]